MAKDNISSAGTLETTSNFGELVRSELKKQKKTQKWLAAEVKVSTTSMTSIVTGRHFPVKNLINNICYALNVKLIFTFLPKTDE